MKKLLYTIALIFVSSIAKGQTVTENYIKNTTYQVKTQDGVVNSQSQTLTDQDKIESITYFDGLGRPIQAIGIRAGGNSEDIITHIDYDDYGRQDKDWLPYAEPTNGGFFRTGAETANKTYYDAVKYEPDFPNVTLNNINAYSQKKFEASPLNRVLKQAAPGKDWKQDGGHEIEFEYYSNSTNEVRRYEVTLNPTTTNGVTTYTPTLVLNTAVDGGYYKANALYKAITKDENHDGTSTKNHTTEEFKDKQGRVILKRTYTDMDLNGDHDTNDAGETEVAHDTYYIYDEYGNLTYVLPPKSEPQTALPTAAALSGLCYQYIYDDRNRLVEKKIPGKGWESIVYNKLDQPIMTQDANLDAQNKWLFTKYDAFGRIAYTGIATLAINRAQAQSNANATAAQYETPANGFYTMNTYPSIATTVHEPLTTNYYDNYNFPLHGYTIPATVLGQTVSQNVKGLPTASVARVLTSGTYKWVLSITLYDTKGRAILEGVKNEYLLTSDFVETELDFVGKAKKVKAEHIKGTAAPIITEDVFTYDHVGRLISQTQKINNQNPTQIVKNNYDNLGQLESKELGNVAVEEGYKDLVGGISIINDEITKTSGAAWQTGLATKGSFSGDGYIEYQIPLLSRIMVGLSTDNTNANYATIDYAIYTHHSGDLRIYESGSNKGSFGSYQAGDTFKVERIGSTINYLKNGQIFYTSLTPSTGALLGDVSMYYNGNIIKGLKISSSRSALQTVDYAYNIRGWLKQINNPSNLGNDLFSFNINYNTNNHGGTNLFNGNIAETEWKTANTDISLKWYKYEYDALNRIKTGISDNGRYNLGNIAEPIGYDKNGNISFLRRQGHIVATPEASNASHFGDMDNLAYTYEADSNKLIKVIDSANSDYGFKDVNISQNDYIYDANGNLTSDVNKDITSITYNHLNLPEQIIITDGFNDQFISYIYDANGVKLKKSVSPLAGVTTETSYAGNYVYLKHISVFNPNAVDVLKFFNHSEGYVDVNGSSYSYVYQYKDHLGNVRLSYKDSNNDGEITGASTQMFFDDFESASGWNSLGATWGHSVTEFDTNFVYKENYSARLYTDSAHPDTVAHMDQSLDINNSEATDYIIYGWAYSDNPVIRLGVVMKTETETGYFTVFEEEQITDKIGQWIYVEKRVTAPANIRTLNMRINASAWWGRAGNVWFDNVGIRKVNAPVDVEILEENNYYPFGLKHKGYNNSGTSHIALNYKFGGKELSEELGLNTYDFGARNYDAALGCWMNIDPLAETMPSYSPYNYGFNSPLYYTDSDGRAPKGLNNPYVIFDGTANKVYIYDDNDTPNDDSDDILLATFDAHNIVTSTSNGKWEDGVYKMHDRNTPHLHGKAKEKKKLSNFTLWFYRTAGATPIVLRDSKYGAYGEVGIYRAKNFRESTGTVRKGMGFHAGREHKKFSSRKTLGCIRCEPAFFPAMEDAIEKYGSWNISIVQNNRAATPLAPVSTITPNPITPSPVPTIDPVVLPPIPLVIPSTPLPIIIPKPPIKD